MYSRSESHKTQAAPNKITNDTKSHPNVEGTVSQSEAKNNLSKTAEEAKNADSQDQTPDAASKDSSQGSSFREQRFDEILKQPTVDIGMLGTRLDALRLQKLKRSVLFDNRLQGC